MTRWFRLCSILFACLLTSGCAAREGAELLVTCLVCGEEWLYVPAATLLTGCMSLFTGRGKPVDHCPKCSSDAVVFHRGRAYRN
jgi:hypothetical protein